MTSAGLFAQASDLVASLETRLARLQLASAEKSARLGALRARFELEMAVICGDAPPATASADACAALGGWLAQGEYGLVLDSAAARELLGRQASPSDACLAGRVARMSADGRGLECVLVAAALLQLYVQANWTGPPVRPGEYPLPYEAHVASGPMEQLRAAQDARALSASSGKSAAQGPAADEFPALHALCVRRLERSGENVYPHARWLHLLDTAQQLLELCAAEGGGASSLGWWRARAAVVHHESLESRGVADALKRQAERGFAHAKAVLLLGRHPGQRDLLARLCLETGAAMHKLADVGAAKRAFAEALDVLQLSVALTGALGKRTKFQVEQKSQLVLLASSATTRAPDAAAAPAASRARTPAHADDFGTLTEAGLPAVQLTELDEHTPLHERVQLAEAASREEDVQRRGHLALLDQVCVLGLCDDVKHSYAMEALTAEEMLAYVSRVTEHPDNWMVHSSALLQKSLLEFERYKTKERAVLQMQVLVDQQTDRLTVMQPSQDLATGAPVAERMRFLHALAWPPVWRLKRGLGDKYMELGVLGSALKLYEDLHMWEDAVVCLLRMDLKSRAEALIRERLEVRPSANLWCCLGEVLGDVGCFEKAWEVSGGRYARAKRLLGVALFNQGKIQDAARALQDALAVNPQFSAAWFRLGACALKLKDWPLAKTAYANVVSLEAEDADAWANLCAVLVQLGEMEPALQAISEACKHAQLNWRIWDSYVTVALRCDKYDLALHGMDALLDIGQRRADSGGRALDPRALIHVVNGILARREQAAEHDAAAVQRLCQRFEQFVAKMKLKLESDPDVWVPVCMYYEAVGDADAHRDSALRRCRALMARGSPAWFREEKLVRQVAVTATTLLKPESASGGDLLLFLQGVVGNAKQGPFGELAEVQALEAKLASVA